MASIRPASSASSDIRQVIAKVRQHVVQGKAEKLLEDENFVFHMLKLMVEDAVDVDIKTEFLRVLEDCGADVLDLKSIDEISSTLFGIFHQYEEQDCTNFLVQLLITVTTLIVNSSEVASDPVASLVDILWSITAKVNDVSNRQLRAVACQCFKQLEEFFPGVMWKWRDRFLQAVKQERSDVCQDYVAVLTTVLYHIAGGSLEQSLTGSQTDIRSAVSFIMEHSSLFTPAGLWDIIISISGTLRNTPGISPSIFKPLMLHHMATQDPCVIHIILYLQREYSGEILTAAEEKQLLGRLVAVINQKSLTPAHRLMSLQLLKGYCQLEEEENGNTMQHMQEKLSKKLLPTVFDPVDIHVGKTALLNICCKHQTSEEAKQLPTLLSSLTYLEKLAVGTGENKVSVALYRSLYNLQAKHSADLISTHTIKICQSVLGSFPKLIPLVLDFLSCIREQASDNIVYMNILSSLHKQVLLSPPKDILNQFAFYLLVLKVSSKEPDISPFNTVKYLLSLTEYAVSVDQCSWYLGNAILMVCRSILLNHSTEGIFTELGDLLHKTMLHYMDIDIQDKARFCYALLTGASDKKIREVLSESMQGGNMTEQSFSSLLPGSMNQPVKTDLHDVTQPVLRWDRLEMEPVFFTKSTLQYNCNMEEYYKWIERLSVTLQIKYNLQVRSTSEFESLHALSVKLDTNNRYKLLKEINIPSMKRNETREVNLQLQPQLPLPAVFTASAMFASQKNDTYCTSLSDTEITFTDLLLPFPWNHAGIKESERSHLFDSLWNDITSCEDPRQGIQSVQLVYCPARKLQEAWSKYRLSQDSMCFLFLLPLRYHLLFKVQERDAHLVVSMATDYWKLLTHVNEYIKSFDSVIV